MVLASTSDRYAVLLNDAGPVRLCWHATPGDITARDFPAASAAIANAARLSSQPDFQNPWLADADGNCLTYGSELPALIADFLTKGQDAIASGRPSEWLRRLFQEPPGQGAALR